MAKYPNITVKLTGEDGNVFSILGIVTRAMKKAKISDGEIKSFTTEAMSGSYDNLLCVCMDWVNVK